jgi:hypothetical protein
MVKVDKTMAKHMAKKKTLISMRIDRDLFDWTKGFAKHKNVTMTELVVGFLRELRESETEVPQI